MKNLYVISGVTGMTGNELVRQLAGEGNHVIGFDNFFASSLHTVEDVLDKPEFEFFEYDINNAEQMKTLKSKIMEVKAEYHRLIYINCAAIVHTEHFYYVNRTFETNVLGMKSFLDQAIEVGADVYINCSTSEVYSMNSWNADGGVRESDFITMANAEHSQRTSKNELYPKHIIPHILHALQEKGSVELLENSKVNRRTFLYNEDSCSAVIALTEAEEALDGSVYNVATEEEISIVDLVKLCGKKLGIEDPQIIFKGYRESDPERRILNTEKIRERTDWIPKVNLDKGIEMCVEELKK